MYYGPTDTVCTERMVGIALSFRLHLVQSIQWNIKYYYLNNEMNTNTQTRSADVLTTTTKTNATQKKKQNNKNR